MLFVDLYIWKSARILVNDIYKMMHNCKDYSFKDFKYCTCDERCNIQKEINKISKGCLTLIKILKNKETK